MTEANGKGCDAMPDIAEICSNCKAEYEQSIQELRQENERLKAENTELKNKPAQADSDIKDTLIDLVAPSIERWEKLQDMGSRIGDDMKLIVATYRIVRPRKK